MWKMWKTFCRKKCETPDFTYIHRKDSSSFPHFSRNEPDRQLYPNKLYFSVICPKKLHKAVCYDFFASFHSALVLGMFDFVKIAKGFFKNSAMGALGG